MTDNTDNIAGQYPHKGPNPTVILDEGAPTVTASGSAYDGEGLTGKVLTWANQIAEGNLVALSNDEANTWEATDGLMVVEKPVSGETFVIGRVASTPKLVNFPADTDAGDSLIKQLAGGYFRTAEIELMGGITDLLKAEVQHDGTRTVAIGVASTLKHNLVSDYADDDTNEIKLIMVASGGVGLVPCHYVAAGTVGDVSNCLVGITGMLMCITGS